MFERIKKLFSTETKQQAPVEPVEVVQPPPEPKPKQKSVKKPRKKKAAVKQSSAELSPKEIATAAGEPWVNIVRVDLDPNNINSGAFTLDWNDKFVLNLIRAGYKIREDDSESDIVDRWFQTTCRNVALEMYEQSVADPKNRQSDDLRQVVSRDLGDGRKEIS